MTLVLGLMSAEAVIVAVGYLAAYGLAYEHGKPWWPRLRALIPFMLIVVVWRVACTHMGYGSVGSGSYIDPGASPVRFAEAMLVRMPTLLLAVAVAQYFKRWSSPLARFHFAAPLRDPRWKFVVWQEVGYGTFDLPAQGQTVRLPAADMSKLVMSAFKRRD